MPDTREAYGEATDVTGITTSLNEQSPEQCHIPSYEPSAVNKVVCPCSEPGTLASDDAAAL